MSNIIEKLTENIVARDLSKEGAALVNKWEKTGLLEGLGNDKMKDNMSRLLENQAKELLREASSMAAGDVEGFAAVAFPIVRRVFGGLLANDLVSVQPMSLPSGLIFFLDFTKEDARLDNDANESVYGGGKVASQITGGVSLSGDDAEKSFYSLNNGYASPVSGGAIAGVTTVASGVIDAGGNFQFYESAGANDSITLAEARRILKYDPDLASGTGIQIVQQADIDNADQLSQLNKDDLITIQYFDTSTFKFSGSVGQEGLSQVRRLTTFATSSDGTPNKSTIFAVMQLSGAQAAGSGTSLNYQAATPEAEQANRVGTALITRVQYATADNFAASNAVGSVIGASAWLLEGDLALDTDFGDTTDDIPEIDIKVDSIAVTAITKKLKAKWSPELGQDLNAYHNLDAEVELTGILSEQVALEIDREILNDLIQGATAGKLYWSRNPGQFLNRETGVEVGASSAAPDFTGTVSEWYETLLETVNDVSARIHRKTLRGGANFMVTSPEVASILEFTAGFRASVTVDGNGSAGATKVGNLSKKYDVYVDPYFPRNVVLVGRKGGSFLESGYVYAPYVPLQVTPTIFGPKDFTPRKGVMTRYAKKMVRPDMYGLVICQGLVGSSGATA